MASKKAPPKQETTAPLDVTAPEPAELDAEYKATQTGRYRSSSAVVEARIEHLADMMRNLEFKTGKTVKIKAKEWGVGEQRVRELSAEASKRVRAEFADPDRVIVKVTTSLDRVIDDAIEDMNDPEPEESPDKARRALIEAAKTLAILTGANAPQKVEIGLSKLSDEEVEAKYRELQERLKASE